MDYKRKNYGLLSELHQLLKAFPFKKADLETLKKMDLKTVQETYYPNSEIDNDKVANAIVWVSFTLEALKNKEGIKNLDEVVTFSESILKEKNAPLNHNKSRYSEV